MASTLKYLNRQRFFVYKSDPSLMSMHAACPVLLGCVGYVGNGVFGYIELELFCHEKVAGRVRVIP